MPYLAKPSIWKQIYYWIVCFFILAFFFEMISSMILYRKYTTGNLAILHFADKMVKKTPPLSLYHDVQEKVRPDSSKTTSRAIADAIWEANKYSYEPWLQFRAADYKSEYVNISGFERKCVPNVFINKKSSDTIDIYFFGGSTMYGYNVSDAETIPSQFLDLYRKKFPSGKSVRIKNFGVPYYYSKQELLLLTKLIFEGQRPDMVIFLDGLNDFYPSRMLYYDRPHFSYAMQQAFDDKMFQTGKRSIIDTSDQFYIDAPGIPSAEYYQQLYNKYINNITQATRLCEQVGTKSFFFCQPVPFYNYPNRNDDPISYKVSYDRYDYVYPLIQKKADSTQNLRFLGDMLKDEQGLPFVDQVHYSPAFCRKIAEQMLNAVEQSL